MLHVQAVACLGPKTEQNETVEDGWNGEGQVVVFEPFGSKEQKKRPRHGRDEDAEGDSRVVKQALGSNQYWKSLSRREKQLHTTEIAHLLHGSQVGNPEMLGCQERGASARPAHLL